VTKRFLPANKKEMAERGWDYVDIILVTGDAYIDHPSFGVALIGRWLEHHGFRVAILAQPRYNTSDSFKIFGPPRLFWGITGGNLDSIVANYTGNAKVREDDSYSSHGNPYFGKKRQKKERRRPDRAVTRYANLARQAYKNIPVVLGGLEASLRRFVHFDYQQNRLRASVLTDAKADILVYGMGERAVLEIARRLEAQNSIRDIPGTCVRLTPKEKETASYPDSLLLSSWQEINKDKGKFLQTELILDRHSRSLSRRHVVQQQQSGWVVQNPPQPTLTTTELDKLYSLPYVRAVHHQAADVPAWRMIRHSVTIVRGCAGNCSFCAISRHQGPVVVSRSHDSIINEVKTISRMADFKGTISDLGGPTANLYGTSCSKKSCKRHDCLYPQICPSLKVNEKKFLQLLAEAATVKGIKNVYISSGLRMELLLKTPALLRVLLENHVPGMLKIAPEHTEENVLRLMHKQQAEVLPRFLTSARKIAAGIRKKIIFNPYFISAHPGCTVKDMQALAVNLQKLKLPARQFQDFTPTPGTIATAMFVSGLDRDTNKPLFVARGTTARRNQRKVLEKIRGKR
jgi:uncharacterized radical SAM protein YgiQ